MTEKQDGGPAFPHPGATGPVETTYIYPELGMSLRDWFAGQALASLILADGIQYAAQARSQLADAKIAYEMADAMLAERSKL